jgi:predicted alpha/beta-fold hydrolase
MVNVSKEHVLDCGNGARLLGSYSSRPGNRNGLTILIHGWEGSIDSSYLLSAAGFLFESGFDVFRLNLRDHGKSHHLNKELFNSTRLDEVVNGTREIIRLFPHHKNYLAGFSLGGNFALRIGIQAPENDIPLDKIVAICPLVSPLNTTENMEKNLPVYHRYFVKKWQKSLQKKITLFPDLGFNDTLSKLNSLSSMNDYFVPNHTDYATPETYLNGYALTEERLAGLTIDSHIIASEDDPITCMGDLREAFAIPASLRIEITQYGGHCGFLKDFRLNSWADQRLLSLFK